MPKVSPCSPSNRSGRGRRHERHPGHRARRDRRRHGWRTAHRRTVGRDHHAARAVRAGGRRGVGQDQRHGRARGLPRARRPRSHPARRQPGRASGQRAVPHLHGEGNREPAEPGASRPRRHRPARGRRATDRELPRHGRPGAGSIRHPRRHRAGAARAEPGPAGGARRPRPRRDDVRSRQDRMAAQRGRQDPQPGRAGPEPPGRARRHRGVLHLTSGGTERQSVGPRLLLGAGTHRTREGLGRVPEAQARPGGHRLRRPDRARHADRHHASRGGPGVPRPVRRRAARRIPGHERGAGPADGSVVRRRSSRHRRR